MAHKIIPVEMRLVLRSESQSAGILAELDHNAVYWLFLNKDSWLFSKQRFSLFIAQNLVKALHKE